MISNDSTVNDMGQLQLTNTIARTLFDLQTVGKGLASTEVDKVLGIAMSASAVMKNCEGEAAYVNEGDCPSSASA